MDEITAPQKPSNVAQVIDALGGVDKVAERYGVGATAVYNWKAWDRFPPRLHLEIFLDCQRQGIEYDPRKVA